MSVLSDLVDAIENKKNVRFTYDGHVRECSPHAVGKKAEKVNCLVYQYGGMTSKGPVVRDAASNWRCLDTSKIRAIEFIDGDWRTFENHSRPASCIDEFIAEVKY